MYSDKQKAYQAAYRAKNREKRKAYESTYYADKANLARKTALKRSRRETGNAEMLAYIAANPRRVY